MQASARSSLTIALGFAVLTGCSLAPHRPPDVHIDGAHRAATALALSSETNLLASGGRWGLLRLWRVPTGEPVRSWQAHREHITGIVFVNRGRRLISSSIDGTVAVWGPQAALVHRLATPSPVTALAVNEREAFVLTGHWDGSVRRWRLPGFEPLQSRQLHQGRVLAVAVSETGYVASSGVDGQLWLWSQTANPRMLERPPTDSHTLVFSPDDRWLYGAGWSGLFRWDLETGSLEVKRTEHHGRIADLEFTANGAQLASISRITDSTVLLLDPASGDTLQRLQPHPLCGAAVVVSGDGRLIASTSDDGSIRIWQLGHTGESLSPMHEAVPAQ